MMLVYLVSSPPLHRDVSLILNDLLILTDTLFNHQKPIQREVEYITSQFEVRYRDISESDGWMDGKLATSYWG